ncbi:hypothetical protein TNCV_230151 [Trichonephila clavipes]|nr:hypothetical protein TNCV_230151 [Trichonephila clavipes]
MAPHKPRRSAAVEYTTDAEDMIAYDVEEDEFKPNAAAEFVMSKFFRKPHEYVRTLTPTRFRKILQVPYFFLIPSSKNVQIPLEF